MTLLEDTNTLDPNKKYFEELVGEGKKFKTPEDLARGKYEADLFVETLKRTQDQLREDYLKMREENMARAKLEDLIDQLANKRQISNDEPLVKDVREQPTFKPEEIESLVSNQIQKHEVVKKQTENYNHVKAKLQERHGDNFSNVLKQQIAELGITQERLDDMARNEPKVLLRTLGLDQPVVTDNFQAPPRSNQRTDRFTSGNAPERTWTYYQNMMKTDPKSYFDPKTNVNMHNDMIRLGEKFKDGDFHSYGQ